MYVHVYVCNKKCIVKIQKACRMNPQSLLGIKICQGKIHVHFNHTCTNVIVYLMHMTM